MIRDWTVISREQAGDFGLFLLTQKRCVHHARAKSARCRRSDFQTGCWSLHLRRLAQNAVRVQNQDLDAGEDIEIFEVPLEEIPAKVRNEEIDHGMVLLAFFFFWMKQGRMG